MQLGQPPTKKSDVICEWSLSQSTIDIIKATAPVVEEHGLAITKRFYENLFENHPYVNQFFNKSHVFPENGGISPQVRNNLILYSISRQ